MKTIFAMMAVALVGVANMTLAAEKNPVAMVIHGGAGTIQRELMTPEVEAEYREILARAIRAGHSILLGGGSSRDAVIASINIMEDSPLFNAGHGAVLNHDGNVELDASIMEGRTLNAGAVAALTRIKNPINLANAVLEHSPHVMLAGAGAEVFAEQQGFAFVTNDYFKTERRQRQLERVLAEEGGVALSEDPSDRVVEKYQADEKKFGTVGAVAIDQRGDIAAGTSTGGMTNKRFGRIGDAPIIGAGTYADNNSCAVSATGHGEYFIRAAVAHDLCARMRYGGRSLAQAADELINQQLVDMGGEGGLIALAPNGDIAMVYNSEGMFRAAVGPDGTVTVGIFDDED